MQNSTLSSQIQQIQQMLLRTKNLPETSKNTTQQMTYPINTNQSISEQLQPVIKIIFNSLNLNQKLYNSILQKQTQIQQQTKTFLTHSIQSQHKIQQTLKKTKQLYEQTIHQNQKSKFLLQQFITPIKQQLKSKVDQTTFSLQMKMLLDQYDAIGHQITYDMNLQQKLKQQKRKTIQSQTLSFLKDKILPILSELQNKFQSYQQKNNFFQNKLDDLKAKTISMQSQLKFQHQNILENETKILKNLNEKVDQKTVQNKINQLFKTLIHQNNQNISSQFHKAHQFSKNIQSNFNQQLQNVKSYINESVKSQQNIQNSLLSQIQKHQKQFQTQQKIIEKYQIQLQKIHYQLQKYDKNIQFVDKFHKQYQNLQTKLQNGQFKAQSQFKPQEIQLLIQKLNQFHIESKKLKKFQKQNDEKSLIIKGQLQGIRDILSKKANFSDILMHMENKVDKKEFKELRLQFQEYKQIKVNFDNKTEQIRDSQRSQSCKKRHLRNRSFFSPSPAGKLATSAQLQNQEVKRFKLGFNSQFFVPPDGVRKYSKTYHLRQSIKDNNSNIFKQLTHQD